MSGLMSYLAGAAAEDLVAQRYVRNGMKLLAQRWRGRRGELDLVFDDGESFVFVEVKKSKNHYRAAENLSAAQIRRIMETAVEYAARKTGLADNNMRFDVATLDDAGAIKITPNALQMC